MYIYTPTLYVGLLHSAPTANTCVHNYFKHLFLGTESDTLHTNTYQHRTSYFFWKKLTHMCNCNLHIVCSFSLLYVYCMLCMDCVDTHLRQNNHCYTDSLTEDLSRTQASSSFSHPTSYFFLVILLISTSITVR